MAAYCGGRARNTRFGRILRPATLKPFPGKENLSQALDPRSARIESVKSLGDPPAVSFAVEVNRKIRAPSTVKEPAGVRSAAVPWRASPRQTKSETRTTPRAARSGRRLCRERRIIGSIRVGTSVFSGAILTFGWTSSKHPGERFSALSKLGREPICNVCVRGRMERIR
jgi:hypothetical protein